MATVTDILNATAPIAAAIQALDGTIVKVVSAAVSFDCGEIDTPTAILEADLRNFTGSISEIGESFGATTSWESPDNTALVMDGIDIRVTSVVEPGEYLTPTVDVVAAAQLVAALGDTEAVRAFIVEYSDEFGDDDDGTTRVHVVPADEIDPGVFTPAWLGDTVKVAVKEYL